MRSGGRRKTEAVGRREERGKRDEGGEIIDTFNGGIDDVY
jgi:hypothetical protein